MGRTNHGTHSSWVPWPSSSRSPGVARTAALRASVLRALGLDDGALDVWELDAPRLFLLLAGIADHPSGRGPVRLRLASFATEIEARHAFGQLRRRRAPCAEWAEVVAVDWQDSPKRLCWFGQAWDVEAGRPEWWRDAKPTVEARLPGRGRALRRRPLRVRSGGAATPEVGGTGRQVASEVDGRGSQTLRLL